MLTDDLVDVFVVDGSSLDEVEKQLRKFKESIKIVNTFHPSTHKISNINIKIQLNNDIKNLVQLLNFIFYLLDLLNNQQHTYNGASSTTPSAVNIHTQQPPAISVVTFRWDSIKHNRGAPDR